VGDMSNMDIGRDIIVEKNSGQMYRLHETHTAFIPLQYPLIFPLWRGWVSRTDSNTEFWK